MELSAVLEPPEDGVQRKTPDSSTPFAPPETAMEEEEVEEEGAGKGGKGEGAAVGLTHSNDQEMSTEEQEVTSQTMEEKGVAMTAMAH